MDFDFDPAVFLKIGELLCSDEYIYYNGLVFQEDIDRYNRDKENEETIKTKNKKNIIEGISKYKEKSLKHELEILKSEITEIKNKNIKLIKDFKINSFVLEKYKIYEEK